MSPYAPEAVPFCDDTDERDARYRTAEREGSPFFAVETYEEGYAITFDLMPAGVQLSEAALATVSDLVTDELEAVVGDPELPTREVSRSIGPALGHIAYFERETTARELAATLSEPVLDEDNWITATPPGGAPVGDRRN
jgi:hypothetical protein